MNKWLWLVVVGALLGEDPRQVINEVQRRSRADSERYEGTLQVTDGRNRVSDKRWLYERLGSAGEAKAILRFLAPAEVKGVALLVHNHPERASDQWMWTPALQRDRRIAWQDRSTRFFGTDFSFEDLEERDVNQYSYQMLGEETIGGAACWKIESRPVKTRASQYTHSVIWVRKDIYAFARIEAYHNGRVVRRIDYGDFEQVKGIWKARRVEVRDPGRGSRTVLQLDKLDYNVPLSPADFTLQALRRG